MKTVYYAVIQKFEVPDDATEQDIDTLVSMRLIEPTDYIWSFDKNLFEFESE
jgi:hypothetical protein